VNALRDAAKILLPAPVARSIQDALSERMGKRFGWIRPIDLSRVDLIRNASLDRLTDASYLEHELLPRLGLNDEMLHLVPRSLHPYTGQGLLHWQHPNQFSKYLVELSNHRIESYLEIGVRHGGTFVITIEYLSRFHPLREAVGVDLGRSPTLQSYASSRPGVRVMQADSHGEEFAAYVELQEPFDLALIDGDHEEAGCRADFELLRERARILVLHDIVSEPVPGVGKVWREGKASYGDRFQFLEFTDQYDELKREAGPDLLGIGMAISREQPAASTSAKARP
jgi:cephalosporin hydroxylase